MTLALRILVVDDDPDAANSLAELLRIMGHDARAVYDGPTALVTAADFQPALILLDLAMPYMSGFEVARKLRGAPCTIAAVSGHGQQEEIDRCLSQGCDYHLLKPATPSDLQALIGRVTSSAGNGQASAQ